MSTGESSVSKEQSNLESAENDQQENDKGARATWCAVKAEKSKGPREEDLTGHVYM